MLIAVHSYNSLCYGTLPIADLVKKATAMGYTTLPLTDINTTMGVADFVFECQKQGIRPVVGVEFRNGDKLLYVALAKNDAGFAELNRFLTQHNLTKQPYPELAPEWNDVFVIYPFGKRRQNQLKANEYLGVRFSQLTKMFACESFEKLVAMQPVTFAEKADFELHQCMRAIDENVLISRLDPKVCAAPDEILLPAERLRTTYALYPQLIENAEGILEECEKAGNPDIVYQFCSTSKITFPGSGVAAMSASPANVADIKSQMGRQTIGHDKINQLRHVRFFRDFDGLKAHMRKHAAVIRPKFEAVLSILDRELSGLGIAEWTRPRGGYFVSFNAMPGCAKNIVAKCKEAGVTMTGAGAAYPYGKDPQDSNIRIAPTLPPLSEIEEAIELFCICARLAAVEKLLA